MKHMHLKRLVFRSTLSLLLVTATLLAARPSSAAPNEWSKLDLDGVRINTLAVEPIFSSTVYAGTNGGGVFRGQERGKSWQAINNGLGNLFVNDLMIISAGDRNYDLLAATGRGPGLGEASAGVYRLASGSNTWTQQVSAFVDALTWSVSGTLFAAGSPAVLKSTDRGVTWTPSFPPGSAIANINGTGVAVSRVDPNIVLVVGNTEGGVGQIFRSRDGGTTWSLVLGGLPPLHDVIFAPPGSFGSAAFVAADTGVFRSDDSGLTFTRVTGGLGDVPVFKMLFNPLRSFASTSLQVFGATLGQGVIASDDGAHWRVLHGALDNRNVRALAADFIFPQTLYAGSDDGVWAFTFLPPPPPPSVSWFFAEGSTQPPFDTWFLLQNPTAQTATATLTFLLVGGGTATQTVEVPPRSRVSVFANEILPNQAFSTRIDADQRIFAERAMYVGFDGHSVTGIPAPSKTWFFAEGSTQQPFHTWILLANQNSVPATATITYHLENGQVIVQQLGPLPPLSRTSVFVNEVLPNVAFSARVDSDQPIIAERAMYRFPGNAATGVVGVTTPSNSWFFSEARSTLKGMHADSFLLLQNPNTYPVSTAITLYRTDGFSVTITPTLPPTSRTTIHLSQIFSGEFGIAISSLGFIIAERSVFFGDQEPLGAYATQGSTDMRNVWFLPEGSTAPPFEEIISVLNPRDSTFNVTAEFELQTGEVIVREFTIGPNRKFDILVNDIVPNAAVATKITASEPTVVERVMLINKSSLGGTNTIGIEQ